MLSLRNYLWTATTSCIGMDRVAEELLSMEAVFFDVDSTLSVDEGIDVLAEQLGVGLEVQRLTSQAMGGVMSFEESFSARLALMSPSRDDLTRFLKMHPPRLVEGAKDVVSALISRGIPVYAVSGGILELVLPVAQQVGIPSSHIFANLLVFDSDGVCRGRFDAAAPTSRTGGKARVLEEVMRCHGYQRVAIVGDGITDLEARPPATIFIAFGGVVQRQRVMESADHCVTDFAELARCLRRP